MRVALLGLKDKEAMSRRLNLTVTYDVKADTFVVNSDIKPEMRREVLADFIRSQIGAGKDDTPVVERDVYTIKLQLDLSDDTFYVEHDCGNKGLRDGILMHVLETAQMD
ncbi:hypothetical protein LCGC14_0941720 [marine sediment metagenome]|uniref:Uncharacterized protein n=1 Tax=marine sediment metagenome TaxID=412755 RepID=A0A0F9R3L0_9ZZZZ